MPRGSLLDTCKKVQAILDTSPIYDRQVLLVVSETLTTDQDEAESSRSKLQRPSRPISDATLQQRTASSRKGQKVNGKPRLNALEEHNGAPNGAEVEKEAFAKELFNYALEKLSNAVRQQEISRAQSPNMTPAMLPNANPPHPAQKNRSKLFTQSPKKAKPLENDSETDKPPPAFLRTTKADLQIELIIESGSTALTHLWSLASRPSISSADDKWKLFKASLAFLRKILATKKFDLIVSELFLQRRYLDVLLRDDNPTKVVSGFNTSFKEDQALKKSKNDLYELMDFQGWKIRAITAPHVIEFQILILKAFVLVMPIDRLVSIQWRALFENPNFVTSLLTQSSPVVESTEKVTRQLELISSQLFALSVKLSSNCPAKRSEQDTMKASETSLEIHVVALQTRLQWMKIAKHQIDTEAEILRPFLKFLKYYASKSDRGPSGYLLARKLMNSLLQTITQLCEVSLKQVNERNSTMLHIYSVLGDLSYRSGNLKDAIDMTETCLKLAHSSHQSFPQLGTLQLKLTAYNLSYGEGLKTVSRQKQALETQKLLQNISRTTDAETFPACVEILLLLRAAAKLMQQPSSGTNPQNPVLQICFNLLYHGLAAMNILQEQRTNWDMPLKDRKIDPKDTASKQLEIAMESVLLGASVAVKCGSFAWIEIDNALQEIYGLARKFETRKEYKAICCTSNDQAKKSLYVRLSNVYWSAHVHIDSMISVDIDNEKAREKAIHRSISMLEHACPVEKSVASLTGKLEKYVRMCIEQREYATARQCLIRVLDLKVQSGVVSFLSDRRGNISLHRLEHEEQEAQKLISLLRTILDIDIKTVQDNYCDRCITDFSNLPKDQQGLICELHLLMLLRYQRSKKPPSILYQALSDTCSRLFEIYDEQSFPIRRSAVAVAIFRVNDAIAGLSTFDLSLLAKASRCTVALESAAVANDQGLENYKLHTLACLRVYSSFSCSTFNYTALEEHFRTWLNVLNSCSSWSEVIGVIDDPVAFHEQLVFVQQELLIRSLSGNAILLQKSLVKLQELNPQTSSTAKLESFIKLSACYSVLGQDEEASQLLDLIAKSLEKSTVDVDIQLSYYSLRLQQVTMSNVADCTQYQKCLEKAFSQLQRNFSSSTMRTAEKIQSVGRAADALLAISKKVANYEGKQNALFHLRTCLVMLQRVCRGIGSRSLGDQTTSDDLNRSDARETTNIVSPEHADAQQPEKTLMPAAARPLIPRLFKTLLEMSSMLYQMGNFQDAVYHLQLADKVSKEVNENTLKAKIMSRTGRLKSRADELVEGEQLLNTSSQLFGDIEVDDEIVHMNCALAYLYRLRGDTTLEWKFYDKAENIDSKFSKVTSVISSSISEPRNGREPAQGSPLEDPQKLNVLRSKTSKHPRVKSRGTPKSVTALEDITTDLGSLNLKSETKELSKFATLEGLVLLSRLETLLKQQDQEKCETLFERFRELDISNRNIRIKYGVVHATFSVENAMKNISKDPVLGMLNESAVAFPCTREVGANDCKLPKLILGKTVKGASKRLGIVHEHHQADKGRAYLKSSTDLDEAYEELAELLETAGLTSDLRDVSALCSAFTDATFLGSLLKTHKAIEETNNVPFIMAYSLELPRLVAGLRERISNEVIYWKQSREVVHWPEYTELSEIEKVPELDNFQDQFLDILPPNWVVVSITLSEGNGQLYLSRYEYKKRPFVLRLPLDRQGAEELSEEDTSFGFAEASKELQQIIQSSDATVHGARDNPERFNLKGAKTQWWEERKALDSRLRDLLQNIENVWLGGFKGIFSQQDVNKTHMARFKQTFVQILDKHLPSRRLGRKPIGRQRADIELDDQIYELLVALDTTDAEHDDKNAEEEEEATTTEPEDTLTDFLYFLVDILQFNGEANAYDEIDFDSFIVDSQDAIRCYHRSVKEEKSAFTSKEPKHMILILDKELHKFPWEALPCLLNQSVSRVTSFLDIRERILRMPLRDSKMQNRQLVSADDGTYILNPSGDLSKTQSRFETTLATLANEDERNWSSILCRAPSEEEFATALAPLLADCGPDKAQSMNRIMLYFGHGSGTQYIRRRRISQLRKSSQPLAPSCATTLLFGCSSASLKEAGEFEPYGTPKSYLLAGAPALMGTLWDVTDGDCDAFAKGVLSRWGLLQFPPDEAGAQTHTEQSKKVKSRAASQAATKAKGKGRQSGDKGASRDRAPGEPISLSDAVSQSRSDCYLKYLNGAAMVVYGVPVYLDRQR